ncbi:SRPBCC family protein [Sagittula salina]|uniref:SRPBCC family protein n=1 Tax=Sagittula salina TaxID=2820268 RepID=A0A940MN04_9RHOB|nr:SRPBCC family protein [Sagittula salina]MBP0482533.1 SRPBCC family protein [Sagittula salina]
MQLTAREDVEAPLDRVFAALSDFDSVERQALRRGTDVQRTSGPATGAAEGMTWHASFGFRGKTREADIQLTEFQPPDRMVFASTSGGLQVGMILDVVALSRTRTRIGVTVDMVPTTLSARLLVQSLKLAKGGMERRFRERMKTLARDLEKRLQTG